jgi:hypothetical protein
MYLKKKLNSEGSLVGAKVESISWIMFLLLVREGGTDSVVETRVEVEVCILVYSHH